MNLDFKNMTDEQKANLKKQILEEEAKEKAERKAKVEGYKSLVDETVIKAMEKVKGISNQITTIKKEVFDDFKSILELKAELY